MTQPTFPQRLASVCRSTFGPAGHLLSRERAKLRTRRAKALQAEVANKGPLLQEVPGILEKGGGSALEHRLSGLVGLASHDMAGLLTDIGKHILATQPGSALELFRRAAELDPKAYRKKWLAFRLFEQGQVAESAAILSEIAPVAEFSPSEVQKAAEIQYETLLLSSPAVLRDSAGDLARLLAAGDYVGLNQLREKLLAGEPGDSAVFLADLFLLISYNNVGAHHASVEVTDSILSRFSSRIDRIHANAGTENCRRFVEAASQALTKTGRHEDARKLVDSAIGHFGLRPSYLRFRARLFWPYTPAQTLADFEEYQKTGELSPSERLLRTRLTQASPEGALAECPEGEFLLYAANGYLEKGEVGEYARLLNGYLAGQGLLPALPENVPAGADLWRLFANASPGQSSSGGPLVSVIMTTFNAAATLDYAVGSILGQTHRNVELLIVDDASTDATPALLQAWQAKDPRVKIFLSTHNQGTFVSKNELIDVAAGEYLTFHDSDDWAHPERITLHLEEMKNRPEVVATMSDWLRVDPAGKIEFQRWMMSHLHRNLCSLLIRRDLIPRLGYFDRVTFGADTEMWSRISRLFGQDHTRVLNQCLTFGLLRKGSLTQGGAGIFDEEDFSLARSQYRQSWFRWHTESRSEDLVLPPNPPSRSFWAPEAMVAPPPPATPRIPSTGSSGLGRTGE